MVGRLQPHGASLARHEAGKNAQFVAIGRAEPLPVLSGSCRKQVKRGWRWRCSWSATAERGWCTGQLPAQEGIKDEHRGATVWADIGGVRLLIRVTAICCIRTVRCCISGLIGFFTHQQLTGLRRIVLACGVGDQSVVSDAVETRYALRRITRFM